ALGSAFPSAHVHVLECFPADVGGHVTGLAHRAIDPASGGGQDGHVLLDRDAGGGLAADPEHARTVVVDRLDPGAVELLNSPVEAVGEHRLNARADVVGAQADGPGRSDGGEVGVTDAV